MFFRCLLMAGTPTPNNSAIVFCVSQAVSSLKRTPTRLMYSPSCQHEVTSCSPDGRFVYASSLGTPPAASN